MSEQMEFPETFEKYAKEYGFKDDKEVYTNGSYLIPVFRVKQWLEHDNKITVEEYRQRMIKAFHNADCDELIAVCVLPTEKEFEHLEWLLRSHYKKEPCEDPGEISDGYHTFNQLYHQRAILFATIVNQNKDKAWKSYKHSDGKYCFDSNGEWFIVGVDTPKGSYTYHYSKEYWDVFDCKELQCGKEWDGHTEEDVTRLLSLQQQPKLGRWIIKDGKEQGYDIAGIKTWYIQIMCDKCGFIKTAIEGCTGQYKFCPKCGQLKMQEVEEE